MLLRAWKQPLLLLLLMLSQQGLHRHPVRVLCQLLSSCSRPGQGTPTGVLYLNIQTRIQGQGIIRACRALPARWPAQHKR